MEVRHKPARAWKIYRGLEALEHRSVLKSWQLQRIAGHLVAYFCVYRPALAALREIYRAIRPGAPEDWVALTPAL
eukprot:3674820-Lingulodinium_polyedra.AAC.1